MLSFLKENNILSKKQFGFTGGRSTVLQLLLVLEKWTKALDKGKSVDVIFCDFQKAFDTVPHRRLLEVLSHYGIQNEALKWIKDFLTDRKMEVFVNGKKSSKKDVTSGVPQGSVLGPLLFIIYINLLIDKCGEENLFLYADDLKVFKEVSTNDDIENLQQVLDKMYDWTCYSLLRFHPEKCITMRLTNTRSKGKELKEGLYNLNEVKLKKVSGEKDLGVYIDETLSFDDHISLIVKKGNSLLGMIRRSFLYLDKEIFKQLFVSIVRPHLEYAAPVWNPHLKKHITSIESVQRRGTKLIPGLKHLPYKERLKVLDLPTLQYRRYRGDMIETYKLTHDIYDIDNVLTMRMNCRASTAHLYSIKKDRFNKDIGKFYFKNRVADQWNNLPSNVVTAPTINTFKNRLDKIWKKKDIMFDSNVELFEITSSRRTKYM